MTAYVKEFIIQDIQRDKINIDYKQIKDILYIQVAKKIRSI